MVLAIYAKMLRAFSPFELMFNYSPGVARGWYGDGLLARRRVITLRWESPGWVGMKWYLRLSISADFDLFPRAKSRAS